MEQLAVLTRSGYVESIHYGYICVVDSSGKIIKEIGDSNTKIYFRSSAKPIQAVPVIESGASQHFGFTKKEISIMCSSHSGQIMHQDTVTEMLKKIGEEANVLKCGIMIPYNKEEANRLQSSKEKPSVLHCSCSAKHVGMLTLAKYKNYSIDDYNRIDHPAQHEILNTISYFTDYNEENITVGIDGCGAPIYIIPIYNIALSYARIMNFANDENSKYHKACKTIIESMIEYPEMVAGDEEFCTELMGFTNGKLIGKVGSEAVYCVGIKDKGIGICVKIIDGNERAVYPVVMQILKELNILDKNELNNLQHWSRVELKNNLDEVIGDILPSFQLLNKYKLGDKVADTSV